MHILYSEEKKKTFQEVTDSANLCFFHRWYKSPKRTPEPNWNPWAAVSTEKLWSILSARSSVCLSETKKLLQDWNKTRPWRCIQVEHLLDSAIYSTPCDLPAGRLRKCRWCDKHSEQTGTLAHWEKANLTQKSDWKCPELLKQFKCPTIKEYLNIC